MGYIQALSEEIMKGNIQNALEQTKGAMDEGIKVSELLNQGLIAAMDEVGERFSKGLLFVPQMLRSAKAMQECMNLIKPFFEHGVAR